MNNYRIDNLQYCKWSKEIFQINNEAKSDAVHVTIAYHEDFNEVKKNFEIWNKHFKDNKSLIFQGKTFQDIEKAYKELSDLSPKKLVAQRMEKYSKMGVFNS